MQTEEQFKETAQMLRSGFRYLFSMAIRIDVEDKKLGRSGRACERLLAKEENLWHFVEDPTIEPTNNLSERNLRPAVLWRKVSFGTQSERGNRFVERALSMIETLKIQKRNPFEFLAACFQAYFENSKGPSLLAC